MKEGDRMRNRAWRRHKDYTKARRKQEINSYWASTYDGKLWWYYDNLHQYSKNKIHCSCPICSMKTRNKGKRRQHTNGWYPSINYKISDQRKIDSLKFDFYSQK